MIRPQGIDHLVLRVADLPAMLAFYVDVLGATLERRQDGLGLVQLRAGRSLIDLVALDGPLGRAGGAAPGAEGRNLDHFCLRVEPFDEAAIRRHLAAHRVTAGPTARRYGAEGEGPSIYVDDPEGNVVELKGPPDVPAAGVAAGGASRELPVRPPATGWPVLAAAVQTSTRRLPFTIDGRRVGSVAAAHRPALAPFAGFGGALALADDGVALRVPAPERDAAFAALNAALRAQGLVVAWRDETYPVVDPATLQELARFERAASRFWGTLTFGAHATGWVAGADGRPAQLWIAQRSFTKPTDPGLFDNLVGGGVPAGQTPAEALLREGFEEAGLAPAQLAGARPGSVLRLQRDIPEGLQHEWLYSYDLELPPDLAPVNQDGEVAGFQRLPLADALVLAAGPAMTVDAALVTLDFAVRHGLLDDDAAAQGLQALRVAPPR